MTAFIRKSQLIGKRILAKPVRRYESFLAKLMGIQAVAPEVGTPLIFGYGLFIYGSVFYGINNLSEN